MQWQTERKSFPGTHLLCARMWELFWFLTQTDGKSLLFRSAHTPAVFKQNMRWFGKKELTKTHGMLSTHFRWDRMWLSQHPACSDLLEPQRSICCGLQITHTSPGIQTHTPGVGLHPLTIIMELLGSRLSGTMCSMFSFIPVHTVKVTLSNNLFLFFFFFQLLI